MRKYERARTTIIDDPFLRREEERRERFLEQLSQQVAKLGMGNAPVTALIPPGGGGGKLQDHDHSRSGLGGNILGDPTRSITGRGLWEFDISGKVGINKIAPTNRLHVVGPDAAFEYGRPSSTISQGGSGATTTWWTQVPDGNLHLSVDEVVRDDDTTYIYNNPLYSAACIMKFTATDPGTDVGHKLTFWAKAAGGTGVQFTWSLTQGIGTDIASGTFTGLTSSYAEYTHDLTEAQALTITDWTDLRVQISPGGASPVVRITQIYLKLSSGSGGEEVVTKIQGGTSQTLDWLQLLNSDLDTFGLKLPTGLASHSWTLPTDNPSDGVLRNQSGSLSWTTGAGIDHGSLDGLTDDDHLQYFRLAGRSTVGIGQIAYGGVNASENLTLGSTAHATKGKIIIGSIGAWDEVNTRLAVGGITTSGSAPYETLVRLDPQGTDDGLRIFAGASTPYAIRIYDSSGFYRSGFLPTGELGVGAVPTTDQVIYAAKVVSDPATTQALFRMSGTITHTAGASIADTHYGFRSNLILDGAGDLSFGGTTQVAGIGGEFACNYQGTNVNPPDYIVGALVRGSKTGTGAATTIIGGWFQCEASGATGLVNEIRTLFVPASGVSGAGCQYVTGLYINAQTGGSLGNYDIRAFGPRTYFAGDVNIGSGTYGVGKVFILTGTAAQVGLRVQNNNAAPTADIFATYSVSTLRTRVASTGALIAPVSGSTNPVFEDITTTSKKLGVDLSGMTASVTSVLAAAHTVARTLTLPNHTCTLVGRVGSDRKTGQTADITSPVTLLATSHPAQMYRVSVYARCTVAGSGTLSINIGFNDGGAGRTPAVTTLDMSGTNIAQGQYVFYSAGTAAITYSTSGYAAGTFEVNVTCEAL